MSTHHFHNFSMNILGDSPGELSGCWNDVLNMKRYIKRVHGFKDENIVVLLDDGKHTVPTYKNIINAYKKVISQSEDGDAVFLHYSGELADYNHHYLVPPFKSKAHVISCVTNYRTRHQTS